MGSTDELRSAFGNLISNAVRYTPDGGEIEISWTQREGEPIFSVRDTGIGIEPHHIPRLTERFYRVDRSRSRSTGGTGLGLAIVKHVLSRHQGHLEIESDPGRGSTFSAVFPSARVATQPADELQQSSKLGGGAALIDQLTAPDQPAGLEDLVQRLAHVAWRSREGAGARPGEVSRPRSGWENAGRLGTAG